MKKQIGKNLMQKWKNKIRSGCPPWIKRNWFLPISHISNCFLYKSGIISLQKQSGRRYWNKLLYAMEHADRILTGLQPSFNWRDMLTGIVAAVILKLLVWQKQSDAKKLGKESSMVQPDGETLRILNLICRKIPG